MTEEEEEEEEEEDEEWTVEQTSKFLFSDRIGVRYLFLLHSTHASFLGLEGDVGQPEAGLGVLQEHDGVAVLQVGMAHAFVLPHLALLLFILNEQLSKIQ